MSWDLCLSAEVKNILYFTSVDLMPFGARRVLTWIWLGHRQLSTTVWNYHCIFQCQGKEFQCLQVLIRLGLSPEGDGSAFLPIICGSNSENADIRTPFSGNQGHWSPSDLMWVRIFFNVTQYLAIRPASWYWVIRYSKWIWPLEGWAYNACDAMDIL